MATVRTLKPTYAHMPGTGRPAATNRTELTQAFAKRTVEKPIRVMPQAPASTQPSTQTTVITDGG